MRVALIVALASHASALRVLVVGGTGRVGRHVVAQLRAQGVPHRVLARDPAAALAALPAGTDIVAGDLADVPSLRAAMDGVSACIAVSGVSRFTRAADLLTGRLFAPDPAPPSESTHPYVANERGMSNLVEAAKASGSCGKIVRVTGLSVGRPAWSPVALLFNCLLSVSGRHHANGENALRTSGLDYTILRPGGLSDEQKRAGRGRLLGAALAPPARIGRSDLAALAIECLTHPDASRATLCCAWTAGAAPDASAWSSLLAAARPSCRDAPAGAPRRVPPYRLAVGTAACAAAGVATAGIARLLGAALGVRLPPLATAAAVALAIALNAGRSAARGS